MNESIRILLGLFKQSNYPGVIALTDILTDTFENKYGKAEPIKNQFKIKGERDLALWCHKTIEKRRKSIIDQEILDIVDQLDGIFEKRMNIPQPQG